MSNLQEFYTNYTTEELEEILDAVGKELEKRRGKEELTNDKYTYNHEFTIYNTSGEVIYSTIAENFTDAIEKAVAYDIDLRNADFTNKDLTDASMGNTDLSKVSFRYAVLSSVDMEDAEVTNADFFHANCFDFNCEYINLHSAKTYTKEEGNDTDNPWGMLNLDPEDISEKAKEMYEKFNN